jgi:phenylalanyl-tRNA synthetase beta chain
MNVSYRWLRALAPTLPETPAELADRLAMLGAPVDEIVHLGAGIRDVVIARVREVRPHPNADRLRLCIVEAGGESRQVVCGAPNVEAGGFYPFAPIGATLPGGLEIRKAKLRGEVSEGMLCSPRELGLGRDHAGLMTLAGDWTPGESFVEAMDLDDARLVVDVTPNRPDLLSHAGIAREAAAAGSADLRVPPLPGVAAVDLPLRSTGSEGELAGVRVSIADSGGCPRYLAAVLRGVSVGPSPEWLAGRLRAVGLRPINNVVDATNYVLQELGQPLHAFDLARLTGPEVRIRRAQAGETIRTLDGVDRPLQAGDLVIADAARPVALAGVMGGEESEVSEGTSDLLLECALFDPATVRRTRSRVGLSTDASYRFERGVDPEGLPAALARVVEIILAVAGGTLDGDALDLVARPFRAAEVGLRPERVASVLGVSLEPGEIQRLLGEIGFHVDEGTPLRVRIPGFRPDVTREIDLIEEIARRRGYDSFPEALLPFRPSAVPTDPRVPVEAAVRSWLGSWGFLEARTAAFSPAAEARVPLLNPLSAEESHLRDALLPGLLRRVEHNWSHGVRDVRLYEIGTAFLPGEEGSLPREEIRLAAVFTGAARPPHWSGPQRSWDEWDLRALLDELAGNVLSATVVAASEGPRELDAGLMFGLSSGTGTAGVGGRVAASVLDAPPWAGPVWGFEVPLPTRTGRREPQYAALPERPASERDLALLLPEGVRAGQVAETIRGEAGDRLEALFPFDLYTGKGIPEGTRSLAWRLRFRAPERTLTDAEVEAAVDRVVRALDERLGVRRR